jgi:hypothetical protein
MDIALLNPEIQKYINSQLGVDISKLALQKNPFPEVNWVTILNQIAAKSKAKDKLPTYFSSENIIYPSKISVEQTSSEKTALYKSKIVNGETLIDLTGGFGVDCFYYSMRINKVIHCEIDGELSDIVNHNFKQFGIENVKFFSGDSYEILNNYHQKIDWIYIDPSRRNDQKGKVFMLKDCLPNVPDLLSFYFTKTNNILIKTAPILDISAGLFELTNVKCIHIVAVDNEVKELLWELNANFIGNTEVKTINIFNEKLETFNFEFNSNLELPDYELPKNYLYEPNNAIMKSGGFDEIGIQYNLGKLHSHSHLYTSENLIEFPGRIFEIKKVIHYSKKEMKTNLENTKANITTRNFPESVEEIRKKWKIKDGGSIYSFFTTDLNNDKIVLLCNKIK